MNIRTLACRLLTQVMAGHSLAEILPRQQQQLPVTERALLQELCFGSCRYFHRLDALLNLLLTKALPSKQPELKALLILGSYQLLYMRQPAHAVLNETVNCCKSLKLDWAKGLVNAVLRRIQRERDSLLAQLDAQPASRYSLPDWLLNQIQHDWPQDWAEVAEQSNQPGPLTLRVNTRHQSRAQYRQQLQNLPLAAAEHPWAPEALVLEGRPLVESLPGFAQGWFSVQDAAAQLAARLLAPQAGERILDACCAPGGKTAHLLEQATNLQLIALDKDPQRLERVQQNLARLQLQATLIATDAGDTSWWDGQAFDAILLDAPCSATGVIRRHPDIKLLRRPTDVAELVQQQRRLLNALWPLLKPGGRLLYATCSILDAENRQQIDAFVASQHDARIQALPEFLAEGQIRPGQQGMDGFFYQLLSKN